LSGPREKKESNDEGNRARRVRIDDRKREEQKEDSERG